MRTVGVVTGARSDYGIYLPLLMKLEADPDIQLYLYVSGMHLSPEFGMTVDDIRADGFEIREEIEMLLSGDTPGAISKSMGLGLVGFAQAFTRNRPDILVLLGDRFEMHAAGLAALPFRMPIAHIHGGELTTGAIDDALRHSLTKLSHLHFVTTPDYARRVAQLGERPDKIHVAGSLSLANLDTVEFMSSAELAAEFEVFLDPAPLLATFHPTSLEYDQAAAQFGELLAALDDLQTPVVFTLPNADTGGRILIKMITDFVDRHPWACSVKNFGTRGYFSMMKFAAAMVGNSSSGIIEAASFGLPVVNIGNRQQGRVRGANVIDVATRQADIADGLRRALSPDFREKIKGLANPYDQGDAAAMITGVLKTVPLGPGLIHKTFNDLKSA